MLILFLACTDTDGDSNADTSAAADSDSDSAVIDTAPPCDEQLDSDGDGYDDCTEQDCVSDPLDAEEVCYACGWPHGDPGDLTSTGDDLDDTIENLTLWDACGEKPGLWEFAGSWKVLMITTSWCEPCKEELAGIETHRAEARESTGVADLDWLVVLYQNASLGAPLGDDAGDYSDEAGVTGLVPVLSDPTQQVTDIMPWDGSLPGKCLLSPEMTIGTCWSGADDSEAMAWLADQ